MKKTYGIALASFLTASGAYADDSGLPTGASPLCNGNYYLSLTGTKYPIDRQFTQTFTDSVIKKVNAGLHPDITVEEYFDLFQESFVKTSNEFEALISQQDLKPALTVGGFLFRGDDRINYGTKYGLAYSLSYNGEFSTADPDAVDMLFWNAETIVPSPINVGIEFKNFIENAEPGQTPYSVEYTLVEGFASESVLTRGTPVSGLKIEQHYSSDIVPAVNDYDFTKGGSHVRIYCRPDEDGPAVS